MLHLIRLAGVPAGEGGRDEWQGGLIALIVVALISVGISFVRPTEAMWAYLLLLFVPGLRKWRAPKTA